MADEREGTMLLTAVKWFACIDENDIRADEWRRVFGRLEVPVLPQVSDARLPGFDEPQAVYMLDMRRLTAGELTALKSHLAGKFGLTFDDVERDMLVFGVPIRADGVTLRGVVCHAQ